MARPQRNTVDYFPHYISSGKKMFFIESRYKNDGYAVWFRILEMLGSSENHYLNLNNEQDVLFISARCFVAEDLLILIINDLAKIGAIDAEFWENKIIWSETFSKSIEDAYKKRNNKMMNKQGLGILLQGLGILKHGLKDNKAVSNPQSKVEYIKEEERRKREEQNKLRDFIAIEFLESFETWMSYKKARKESYKSIQSEKAFYDKLLKFSNNNPLTAKKIIEQSMANNWAGIFELKELNLNQQTNPIQATIDAHNEVLRRIDAGEF